MSYNSVKQNLILSVDAFNPKHHHYSGRQVMALCRYLQYVAKAHEAVGYSALKAYTERNYMNNDFPLDLNTVYRIIHDMEMRRNQTLKLIADYNLWYKDPIMHRTLNRRVSRRNRKKTWRLVSDQISTLWPVQGGKWPQKSG